MKKISKSLMVSMLFIVLSCVGCGSSSSTTSSTTELETLDSCSAVADQAVICGTAYAPDGVTPIAGAKVVLVTASGNEAAPLKSMIGKAVIWDSGCFTTETGVFVCGGLRSDAIPTGTASFRIQGSGFNFTTGVGWVSTGYTINFSTAQLSTNQTYSIPAADTTATSTDTTAKWLVVPGSYDGVQLLLSQIADCTLTGSATYPQYMTGSADCEGKGLYMTTLAELDELFSSVSNINTYTDIFVNCATDMSSYATVLQEYVAGGGNIYFSDLANNGLTAAFPDNINFGTSATDAGTLAAADVDYSALATYLGSSTIEIIFNLLVWQSIDSVESNVVTYISGDESELGGPADAPITVGWKQGTGGCVFYTSYHIEGASTGADQEKALKYLILNIDTVCQ